MCSLCSSVFFENLIDPFVKLIECSVSLSDVADPVGKAYVGCRMVARIAVRGFNFGFSPLRLVEQHEF